jgi:hypothetical protein
MSSQRLRIAPHKFRIWRIKSREIAREEPGRIFTSRMAALQSVNATWWGIPRGPSGACTNVGGGGTKLSAALRKHPLRSFGRDCNSVRDHGNSKRTQIPCHAALDKAAYAPSGKKGAHEVRQHHQIPQEIRGERMEGPAVLPTLSHRPKSGYLRGWISGYLLRRISGYI